MSSPPSDPSDDQPGVPFDPYRFGAPEHPVPPEYAPPGYVPPTNYVQPPASPQQQPQYPGWVQYPPQQPGQQYPGQQPGYPAPFGSQYPQPKPGNGKSIASLVLGIASIVFCWTTILDIVPVVLAIVFGFLGLGDANRGAGAGQAIAGIACAAIGAILAIALIAWFYSRIHPCLQNYNSGSTEFNSCIRQRI